jgi:hypothetical protein
MAFNIISKLYGKCLVRVLLTQHILNYLEKYTIVKKPTQWFYVIWVQTSSKGYPKSGTQDY